MSEMLTTAGRKIVNAELKALELRLSRGLEMLRNLEDQGETGPRYERLLRLWLELLAAYELKSGAEPAGDAVSLPVAAVAGL